MKRFTTKSQNTTQTTGSKWRWFVGLYVASFIVVGGFMAFTHWLGSVLHFIL